jgi:hypothetical protein
MSGKGVIPYQSFGKPTLSLAVLAGQDSSAGASTIYSPQYVVGGSWRSTLSVINLDSSPGRLTLRLIGDEGGQLGATRTLPIGGNGKVHIADQMFFAGARETPIQGYVEISSDGVRLSGSVVFGDRHNEAFATALPLVREPQETMIFSHIASDARYFTGLALLNPNESEATATIDLYRSDGILEATTTELIPAKRRISRLVTEYFPELAGVERSSGYIRVKVDMAVASFALFGTRDLSVLSAIPAQRAP